ncbi:hypothetical protein [Leifsonia poae]|uniref:hypothetical protein n=1 Tax=Leifsonia poae TaxID=110933 RepID=UPI001CBF69CA|nr:hypothetical protein [Leifsonia poae]
MSPTARAVLGWVSALLLNVGALTFVAGLVLPRAEGATTIVTGVALCLFGAAAGAFWLLASRAPHP